MRLHNQLPKGLMIVALVVVTVIGSLVGAFTAMYVTHHSRAVQAAPIQEASPREPSSQESLTQTPMRTSSAPVIPGNAFHPTYLKSEPPLVQEAKRYLGVPYLFGGEYARDGAVDCSSYTQMVFAAMGVTLPRTTYGQVEVGRKVSRDELMIGDLVFFENTSILQTGVTHVGIYIGNGEFIHAAGTIGYVAITPLSDPFYSSHYHSARRVMTDQ